MSAPSYERNVQTPEEIDDLVGELHSRTVEQGLTRLFLDHEEEQNIVRGRNQLVQHDGEVPEVKRRDGGKTWYHDDTKCFMLGVPDGADKFRETYMEQWGKVIIDELEELGYDAFMADSDIYESETGRQLVGLSGSNTDSSTVLRACWYEDEPEIDRLLEADEKDKQRFHESYETVEGLYQRLTQRLEPVDVGDEFISKEIMDEENDYSTNPPGLEGSCIERYPV